MAVATKTCALPRNDMVDALLAYLGAQGKLIIYEDVVPATADTALDGANTVLATFTMASPSGTVTTNVLTITPPADVLCTHTGTATFFRVYKNDGTTKVWQGTVGTADADLVLNSAALANGATVSITALTYTLPE